MTIIPPGMPAPRAKQVPVTITQLGRSRTDPYQWLKDENWQKVMADPGLMRADIRAYLEAENAFTKAGLEAPTTRLRETLFAEMRGRIKEDDSSLPDIDGPYAYLTRYRKGGQYPTLARRPAEHVYTEDYDDDEILLDGDALGKDKPYFSIAQSAHAPNHRLLAWSVDEQGNEFYSIRFKDLETGQTLPQSIEKTHGDFVWGAGSDRIFWVARDDNGRPYAVNMFTLSDGVSTQIYKEADPSFFVSVQESQSGEYIFIGTGTHVISEWRFFPAGDTAPSPRLIASRDLGADYTPEHWGKTLAILTNSDGAVDFEIVTAPLETPTPDHWQPLVSHSPGTLILGFDAVKDHLIRTERQDGLPRITVLSSDGDEHSITFDEAAYDLDVSAGLRYDTTEVRVAYASPTTPTQVYDYDLVSKQRVLRKTQEIPSGHDASRYVTERLFATARDGQTVPITLLRLKTTQADGSAPLLLYGYGSYGHTVDADFNTACLSLVDRGMVYAIAHPRGSMAKGYQWYLDGKLSKKANTFNDYLDVARHLIAEKYTSAGKIVGYGGSAGGLLMGAVSNQAPELFAGIVAMVPFVDTLNTMSDESLPLTPIEWPEWGNPLTSEADYDTILAYSPYDQVADRPYPPMLITGGISDPRVTYWEPAKWIARLRSQAPEAGPYFLHMNMDAGHGGASGRLEAIRERALAYAFTLSCVGLAH